MLQPFVPELPLKPRNYQLADWKYEKVAEQITKFQDTLDSDHEVALWLTSFGSTMLMQVTEVKYQNPDLFYFFGYVNGVYSQLIQHSSQLNFLLTSVEKEDKTKPPRRIGFSLPSET